MAVDKTVEIVVPSSPADLEAIRGVMKELSNSLTRSESENDYRKDAFKDLAEKYGIEAKYFKQMLTDYHKDRFEAKLDEQSQYGVFFEAVFINSDPVSDEE